MEIIKVLLISSALGLPFLILRSGDTKNNFLGNILKKSSLHGFLLFITLNSFIQCLSYFAFLPSIAIRLIFFILFAISISKPTLFLAAYLSTSVVLVNIHTISKNSAFANFNSYEDGFSYIVAILILYLSIITAMSSRNVIILAFSLFEKTSKSSNIRLILSVMLSYKFNRLDFVNKRTIVLIGVLTACTLTAGDNIFVSLDTKHISLCISIFSGTTYLISTRIFKNEKTVRFKGYSSYILNKIQTAIERVDLVYTCYLKDKKLHFLEDSLILYKSKMKLLSGGRSRTMVFKTQNENQVIKLFSNDDINCKKYFNFLTSRSFQSAFPEYKSKCMIEINANTTKVICPYFKGTTLYQFCLESSNREDINYIQGEVIKKLNILQESCSDSSRKFLQPQKSTKQLEELHLEYLNKKLFCNWQIIIEECQQYSDRSFEDFRRNALKLIDINSLKYTNISHGDLTFSNIIISRQYNQNKVIFIDPNPTSHELLPATIIDWSKLMQSCSSQWELVNSNPELLRYLINNTIKNFNIPSPQNVTEFKNSLLGFLETKGYSQEMLRLHEAVHLSRALPYIKSERHLAKYVSLRILALLEL